MPVRVTDNLEDIDRALIVKESKRMEEEVLKIKSQNLGRVGSIFKMKEVINGPKKGGQVPTAIRDPKNGDIVVANEEIKSVTLAYCVDNLTKEVGDKSKHNGLNYKKHLHNMRIEEVSDENDFDINAGDFSNVLKKFGTKTTKSYNLLVKAGKSYKESLKLCKKMIQKYFL